VHSAPLSKMHVLFSLMKHLLFQTENTTRHPVQTSETQRSFRFQERNMKLCMWQPCGAGRDREIVDRASSDINITLKSLWQRASVFALRTTLERRILSVAVYLAALTVAAILAMPCQRGARWPAQKFNTAFTKKLLVSSPVEQAQLQHVTQRDCWWNKTRMLHKLKLFNWNLTDLTVE
jgi:hypothetical protein